MAAAIAKLTAETAYERDGSMAKADELNECIAVGRLAICIIDLDDAVKEGHARPMCSGWPRNISRKISVSTGWYIPRNEKRPRRRTRRTSQTASSDSRPTRNASWKRSARATADPPVAPPARSTKHSGCAAPAVAKIAPRIVRSHTAGHRSVRLPDAK